MNLTEQDTIYIFNTIKKDIVKAIEEKKYDSAACLIEKAAGWAYNFNFKYADLDLEDNLNEISTVLHITSFNSLADRVVFLCSGISDFGELTLQYIRAFKSSSIPYLLIVVRSKGWYYNRILQEIQTNSMADVIFLDESGDYLQRAQKIINLVESYRPSKILSHIRPWDVLPLLALSALRDIPSYNIDFNDHSFWLGASILDFCIEFRAYGSKIAIEKRGLKPEQIYYLPYYPIITSDVPFQGFPFDPTGKVVIFTGGSAYKMLGGKNIFFNLIDRILDENENAVVFIASGQSEALEKPINRLKNKERVYLSGLRTDISEVFKHCDIYLGTYPLGGGLMTQYAAIFGKPILAYAEHPIALGEINGLISFYKQINIVKYTIDELCEYAHRLCMDERLREEKGEELKQTVITRKDFEDRFLLLLNNRLPYMSSPDIEIDYKKVRNIYLELNNRSDNHQEMGLLLSAYYLNAFWKFPKFSMLFLKVILNKILKRLNPNRSLEIFTIKT